MMVGRLFALLMTFSNWQCYGPLPTLLAERVLVALDQACSNTEVCGSAGYGFYIFYLTMALRLPLVVFGFFKKAANSGLCRNARTL